jgi:hypothetical protein
MSAIDEAQAAVDDLSASVARAEEAAALKDDAASWKAVETARGALTKAETKLRALGRIDEREKREAAEAEARAALEAKRAELAEAQRIRDAEVVTDADAASFLAAADTIAALHDKFEKGFAAKFQADCRAAELSTELHGAGARLRAAALPAKVGFTTILGKRGETPRDVATMQALAEASRAYADNRSMVSEQARLRRSLEIDKVRLEEGARDNERWHREATEEVQRLEAQIASRREYVERRNASVAGVTDSVHHASILGAIADAETKIAGLSDELRKAREKLAQTERGRLAHTERMADLVGKMSAAEARPS